MSLIVYVGKKKKKIIKKRNLINKIKWFWYFNYIFFLYKYFFLFYNISNILHFSFWLTKLFFYSNLFTDLAKESVTYSAMVFPFSDWWDYSWSSFTILLLLIYFLIILSSINELSSLSLLYCYLILELLTLETPYESLSLLSLKFPFSKLSSSFFKFFREFSGDSWSDFHYSLSLLFWELFGLNLEDFCESFSKFELFLEGRSCRF